MGRVVHDGISHGGDLHEGSHNRRRGNRRRLSARQRPRVVAELAKRRLLNMSQGFQ